MSKLQNIKAVKQLLNNNHFTQTRTVIGYEGKKDQNHREVGEIWEEVLPNGNVIEWEQKKGYKVKINKNLKALSETRQTFYDYSNCYDTCKKSGNYNRHDQQSSLYNKMCFDCLALYETRLKASGEYDEYVRTKELANIESFIKDAEIEKEIIKLALDKVEYVEEDGSKEKWIAENKKELLEKIDNDFEKLKKELLEPFLKNDQE